MERSTLRRRLIVAKYGSSKCDTKPGICTLNTAKGPTPKEGHFFPSSVVDQHAAATMGDGCSVAFWHDSCVSSIPLNTTFSNLFALSLAK